MRAAIKEKKNANKRIEKLIEDTKTKILKLTNVP